MAVYVDDVRLPFRGMIMCHMIADTSDELHAMARALGLATRWVQRQGTPEEHYDIALEAKQLAIELGAIQLTRRELIWKIRARRPVV